MEEYLESEKVEEDMIAEMIGSRKVYPCYFGSALKIEGVQEFMDGMSAYIGRNEQINNTDTGTCDFGAKVFKIARDEQGNRLTHLKVTGGTLKVKDLLCTKTEGEDETLEKVNQIIHPAVKKYLADRLAEARAKGDVELFFVEAALLIENGFGEVVDEMWYIYAREEVRRKRLSVSRGYTPEKIERIMSSQLSENEFRKHCDFVIDNSDSLENSYRQIRQKLEAYTWRE